MNKLRVLLSVSAALICGFAIHTLYGQGLAAEYVKRAAQAGGLDNIIHQPYSIYVAALAFLSAALPTLGKIIMYFLIHEKLPGGNDLTKGLWFGSLLLFSRDDMLRMPMMNLVAGNPFVAVLMQSFKAWPLYPLMGLLIALCVGQIKAKK